MFLDVIILLTLFVKPCIWKYIQEFIDTSVRPQFYIRHHFARLLPEGKIWDSISAVIPLLTVETKCEALWIDDCTFSIFSLYNKNIAHYGWRFLLLVLTHSVFILLIPSNFHLRLSGTRFLQCDCTFHCILINFSSSFSDFQPICKSLQDCSKRANNDRYMRHFHISQFSSNIEIFVQLSTFFQFYSLL